ncbi:MAG: DUF2306 domain-containing protein [Pseudomonadaceae bacterium]|nr:DUF2306 domain-containing protein [Pseudomonadaceae bacterium]
MNWSRSIAWWFMVLLAIAIGVYALSYFLISEMGDPSFKIRYDAIPWSAKLHIIPAGVALILGAFQFHPGLRRKWTSIHRNSGRVYVILVSIAAVGGLSLAWYAPHSPATRLGFASLAVVWFYATGMAYRSIRAGDITRHKQWMVRSYALTLAAVTLRMQLPFYQAVLGLSFDEAYAIVAWFCWIPNLVVAEWFFNQEPISKTAKSM